MTRYSSVTPHTDGFMDYAGLPNAHYLCHTGLTVWSAAEDAAFPGGQTLAQALSGKHYGKIYMMLGINELGTAGGELGSPVQGPAGAGPQPAARCHRIFAGHLPHHAGKIGLHLLHKLHHQRPQCGAAETGRWCKRVFIDCNPIFDDAGGALRADYSGDGVHVKAAYYPLWRDYLFLLLAWCADTIIYQNLRLGRRF